MMMDGEVVFAVVVLCEQCFVLLCLEATASWVLAGKARRRHGLSLYS
jgi:hypothetical protein